MVANSVDGGDRAVHDVQDSRRQAYEDVRMERQLMSFLLITSTGSEPSRK